LTEAIDRFLPYHDALLMANHGAVAFADTLEKAFNKLETLEHTARISLIARNLGNENSLPPEAVQKLYDIRERSGMMRPEARSGQACPTTFDGRHSDVGMDGDETITLTKAELLELLMQSSRL
jgi:L-fuculose-phosphate aldolase